MRDRKGDNPAPPRRHKGCKYAGPGKAAGRAARYVALGIAIPAWDKDARAALAAA
ncbi:hypothetical protein [Streptomyces halobius]|uniref:Uncharacterized protein n=1 Tax=Streptomyces halobius TaxID=2879846 RepID=A0ABY4MFY6_9ACTN|nr:hypothetical protein [Streptomyces halobius]UQA96711.1 hypothetical protein K9S39_36905 [Streptomyces halobius]